MDTFDKLKKSIEDIANKYHFTYLMSGNFVEFINDHLEIHLYSNETEIKISEKEPVVCIHNLSNLNIVLQDLIDLQQLMKDHKLEVEEIIKGVSNGTLFI